jgi:hypothetical protein
MVFRGSRGMNLRVPVVVFGEPAAAIDWLREREFTVHLATDHRAGRGPVPPRQLPGAHRAGGGK